MKYNFLVFKELIRILAKLNCNSLYKTNIYKNCSVVKMSTRHSLIKPPDSVKGMTVLDKSKFEVPLTVPFLNMRNVKISIILPFMKKYHLKVQHIKPLQVVDSEDGDKQTRLLLNPEIINTWNDINEKDREALQKLSIKETDLASMNLTIRYDNFLANDIFRAILPNEQEGFSSFSQIGHIVHVNLHEHLLPYKHIIAEILKDKIPNTRTVINKVDMIDNTYRNFKNEVLCGDNDMMVKIKENRCEFEFDFSKVYWNSRLGTEHERIVKTLNANDVLFDVFAGVGPFSIPAAKKKCIVFANDLNPESYKWLNHNLKANKIDAEYLKTFNKDGRDFIVSEIKLNLVKYINKHNISIVMNLPALAVEFLNAFCGLYNPNEIDEIINPPIVHVYCFVKGGNYEQIAKELVVKNIGFDINENITGIFKVRTVSNYKEMMRVSFKLDKSILVGTTANKRKQDDSAEGDGASPKKNCHKKMGSSCDKLTGTEENYSVQIEDDVCR